MTAEQHKKRSLCAVVGILAVNLGGCGIIGDRAADRTMEMHQTQDNRDRSAAFIVDASHLPPEAIESREETTDHFGCPITIIRLQQGYPVRVILVPATQP